MKIGIIVYSETGNTYSVATRLYNEFKDDYSINIERIEATRDKNKNLVKLDNCPDIKKYDVIILASFVEAFTLNPAMKKYLEEIKTFKNKKLLCFVTEFFPFPWMGGNQAIKQMKNICESKEANILNTGVINWKRRNRENMINNLVDNFKKTLENIK